MKNTRSLRKVERGTKMKFLKYLFKAFFFETLPMGLTLLGMIAVPFGILTAVVLGGIALGDYFLGRELLGRIIQVILLTSLALLAISHVVDYIKKEYKGFKQQQEYKKHIEAYRTNYEEDEE